MGWCLLKTSSAGLESDCPGTMLEMTTVLQKRLTTLNFYIPPKILGSWQLAAWLTSLGSCPTQTKQTTLSSTINAAILISREDCVGHWSPWVFSNFPKRVARISVIELGLLKKSLIVAWNYLWSERHSDENLRFLTQSSGHIRRQP